MVIQPAPIAKASQFPPRESQVHPAAPRGDLRFAGVTILLEPGMSEQTCFSFANPSMVEVAFSGHGHPPPLPKQRLERRGAPFGRLFGVAEKRGAEEADRVPPLYDLAHGVSVSDGSRDILIRKLSVQSFVAGPFAFIHGNGSRRVVRIGQRDHIFNKLAPMNIRLSGHLVSVSFHNLNMFRRELEAVHALRPALQCSNFVPARQRRSKRFVQRLVETR